MNDDQRVAARALAVSFGYGVALAEFLSRIDDREEKKKVVMMKSRSIGYSTLQRQQLEMLAGPEPQIGPRNRKERRAERARQRRNVRP